MDVFVWVGLVISMASLVLDLLRNILVCRRVQWKEVDFLFRVLPDLLPCFSQSVGLFVS